MKSKRQKMKGRATSWRRIEAALFEVEHLTDADVDEELRSFGVDAEDASSIITDLLGPRSADVLRLPLRAPAGVSRPPVHQFFRNLNQLSDEDQAVLARQRQRLLEKARARQKREEKTDDK